MFAQVYWGAAPPSVLCVSMRSALGQACVYTSCDAMIADARVVTRRAFTERRLRLCIALDELVERRADAVAMQNRSVEA